MSKRTVFTLFIALVFMLTACAKTASTPVPTQSLSDFPDAPPTLDMQSIMVAGTQTAVAEFGTPEGGQVQPQIIDPNATPEPNTGENVPPSGEGDSAGVPSELLPAITTIPSSLDRPATYALQKGEFPFCIARRYNLDPDELLALNGLTRAHGYYTPGTELRIPQGGKAFPGARSLLTHPTQYTVLSGDTVYSIACKFGDVDPIAIANQNGLQPPYTLTVGSLLSIP